MPTPLAIPVTRTATGGPSGPGSSRATVAAFVRESVVRRATAAASSPASVAASPRGTSAIQPGPDAIERAAASR